MSAGRRKIPSNGGATSAKSCASFCIQAASRQADIAAVGVTGMLPAVVLLDSAGRLLRPSIQQSDARCGAEVEALRAEIDERAFLEKAGNGINQQLVAAKLRWIERHEPDNLRAHRHLVRLLRLHQLAPHGRARDRTELGARGRVRRPQDGRDRRCAGRAGAYPARRAAAQSRLARNPRRSVGAGRGGKRVKSGNAGHRRRRGPHRLRAWRGNRQRGRRAAQIRRLGRYPDRDRSCASRSAPVSRLSSEARPLRPQRMHGDRRLGAQLVRPPVRRRRKAGGGTRLASRSINGSTGSPRRGPPAARGLSSRRIFLAKRRRSTIRTRARPSMALRFRTTSAISGALFSRPTLMRSPITSRS